MTRWVALLYTVVLSQTRRVTSESLLALPSTIGVSAVRTVLSTGNLILDANMAEADLTRQLEAAIVATWGKPIPVLLRTADDWRALVAANPFPEPSRSTPAQVAVRVMRRAPDPASLAKISETSGPDALIVSRGREIWLAATRQLSTVPQLRALSSARIGIGTWRNASAAAKIAAALD